MKKIAGWVTVMMLMGVVLSGCYSKSCDDGNVSQPVSYKGERMK